jgi:hypothetical protein
MINDKGLIERTWAFQHGVERGIEKGVERGREEGAQALRDLLLTLLAARGLRSTAAQRRRIQGTHSLETLRRWGERAATAATTAAVFGVTAKRT